MTLLWIGSGLVATFSALVTYLYFYGPTESRSDNSVDITASPARVFEVFTDFSRWIRIWKHMKAVDPPSEPVEVGAEFGWTEPNDQRVKAKVLRWDPGACVQLDLQFVEMQQGQRFTMRFEALDLPEGPGCRATMVNELRLGQTRYRVMVPLMKPALNLFYRGVLWRLKVEAEAED